ncbi:MAG: hypothetical protein ETSY2_40785 [Candidatus Entotheonella gemina]|uniref:LamG-like jellyroll fold domain-containing protein n=1 Tax=Candidatus Entotheonella gemina TaxID=1429439 RepID=W4LNL2_9BACT|nr:MAG: hypothetical protein ETSY2_40785 [Candidatus Entotheonella gemina]
MRQPHKHHATFASVAVGLWVLTCIFAVSSMAQTCTPPPSGMVSWWSGDSTTEDIHDGNDGTLQNGGTFATGFVDDAFDFDGIDDFVQVPDATNLDLTHALTIDAWINTNNNSAEQMIVSKTIFEGDANDINYYFEIFGNRLTFAVTGNAFKQGNTSLSSNTWYHVAVTYDGAQVRFYLNGALDGSRALTDVPVGNVADLTIGRHGPTGIHHFNGLIDEVELFDRALSGAEIEAIYNAGHAGKCKVMDDDEDGIPNEEDMCPNSELSATVVIDGCDSGVTNDLFDDGCTMSDLIMECADGASNHGHFVSCVSQLTNAWKKEGRISGREKGAIQRCAAQADIP